MRSSWLGPRGRPLILATILLLSLLTGSGLAILSHDPDDRARQESAYQLMKRFFKADLAREQALKSVGKTSGERLIYSTLSGSVESIVAGLSLPAHPEGGFIVRGAAGAGLVWRTSRLPLRTGFEYRVMFDVTPLTKVPFKAVVATIDGKKIVTLPLFAPVRNVTLAFDGTAEPAYAAIEISEPTDKLDIIWIRQVRVVEVTQ